MILMSVINIVNVSFSITAGVWARCARCLICSITEKYQQGKNNN